MATTVPQASTSTPVSTAAKRPTKTQTFLKSLRAALSIFDDEIATLTDMRETAYKTFVTAYKAAFTKIWPKIDGADITIILHSVKDTELRQLRRFSEMLCPDKEQPKLVEEQRTVPTLDNILGNLVNKIPEQKLPDKETCSLISDVFSNLAEAHRYSATAAKGLADVANLVSPEQFTVVLAAAVPPTLQLVLPPGQVSPLLAPPRSPRHQLRRQTGKSLSSFVKITSYQTHHIQHSTVVMHVHQQEFWQQLFIVRLKNTCSMRQPHAPMWRPNFVLLRPSCTKL